MVVGLDHSLLEKKAMECARARAVPACRSLFADPKHVKRDTEGRQARVKHNRNTTLQKSYLCNWQIIAYRCRRVRSLRPGTVTTGTAMTALFSTEGDRSQSEARAEQVRKGGQEQGARRAAREKAGQA